MIIDNFSLVSDICRWLLLPIVSISKNSVWSPRVLFFEFMCSCFLHLHEQCPVLPCAVLVVYPDLGTAYAIQCLWSSLLGSGVKDTGKPEFIDKVLFS